MARSTGNLEKQYAEMKQKYEALQKMYDVLDQVIENSADAFWIFDGDGKCIRVNAAYEELIGLPREKLIGIHPKELVGTVVSEICTEQLLKTKKVVAFEQEFYLTGKSALGDCDTGL